MSPARAGWPAYLALHRSGELEGRAARARDRLSQCDLCPRECGVDRLAGELGVCCTGEFARVEGAGPHFGEEAPLVGRGGSGTIFFAGCNLACVFCQNHTISQPCDDPGARPRTEVAGRQAGTPATSAPAETSHPGSLRWEVAPERLAAMMLELQDLGCENVNLVSPSHVVPQILAALVLAAERGLRLPLVYNTGGYDSLETLRLLEGVVDVYMPDMKYADDRVAERLSGIPDYVERNREAVVEMYRQVGDLEIGSGRRGSGGRGAPTWATLPSGSDGRRAARDSVCGVARRGLLVRHLVLPGGLAGTASVARFLADEVSRDTYINVMDQYHPAYQAAGYPEISRVLTSAEHREAVRDALSAGLWRLDGQVDGVTRP